LGPDRHGLQTRAFARLLLAATLSGVVGCAVDQSGLSLDITGGGGASVNSRGGGTGTDAGQGGGTFGLGGSGAGGMIGTGGDDHEGTGGKGVGGMGMGGTGNGGGGRGGTGAGGAGTGGGATGGKGVGGIGMGGHVVDAAVDTHDSGVSDTGSDLPVDGGPDVPGCDLAHGMHHCGDTCVSNSSIATCGPLSCTACTVPANGSATCDGAVCGFTCNAGFMPVGGACVRACDTNCGATAISVPLPGGRFTGTTKGTSANSGSCGGNNAPEAVYQIVLTETSDVFVTTHGTKFDTVVYMRRGCCGAEIACNDNLDNRNTSAINALGLSPGTYDIFVDGAGTASGAYTVDIYASPSSALPGESCGRPMRISNMPIVGNSCGYRDDDFPAGSMCSINNGGNDIVFYFLLDAPTMVTFDTCLGTCFDSELYFREVCTTHTGVNEVACNDDACGGLPANPDSCFDSAVQSKVGAMLGAGLHYIVLDTVVVEPTCGLFTLNPTNVPP